MPLHQARHGRVEDLHAIVLAGGQGTRLREAFDGPKVLAPVGGRPFLSLLLEHLERHGIRHVTMAVGYKAEEIIETIGRHHGSISIMYLQEHRPLGTGGALKQALETTDVFPVFAMNGDTLCDVYLRGMWQQHWRSKARLSVAVKHMPEGDTRYGRLNGLVNCGVYLFSANVLSGCPAEFSFEDYLQKASDVTLIATQAKFTDIGVPEDYARFALAMER